MPGPTPRHVEILRFIEPAEHTSAAPHSYPSCKGKKSWDGIDVNPNNPCWWVQAYLERDSRLLEWWEEFHPLSVLQMDIVTMPKVKSMVHWQAVAFCLPSAQREVHNTWIIPPCLAALGRKEYLAPVDPRITQDYQEVWREKTSSTGCCAPKVCQSCQTLSRCILWDGARAPWWSNLFNMEEIWEEVRKDPITTIPSKRVPSLMLRAEEPTSATAPNPPTTSELEGAASPEDQALVTRSWPPPPLGFCSRL